MTQYRLLERLDSNRQWLPEGVAYAEDDLCLLYRLGQTIRLSVKNLAELKEEHFPYERGKQFRWAQVKDWEKAGQLDPESLLQPLSPNEQVEKHPLLYETPEQIPTDLKQYLQNFKLIWQQQQEERIKQIFINLYDNDRPPFREVVEALWRHWAMMHRDKLPFSSPEYNVAFLLYARVFGLAVKDNSVQISYLAKHAALYAPLVPASAGYGARAALSKNVLAMLDSPVMHAWLFKDEDVPQRIIIIGKGLAKYREQVFSDALVTAMRVQASDLDVINDGLISIERKVGQEQALDIRLSVMGADAPLADAETAEAAMSELFSQLRRLGQNTGFIEVHEANLSEIKSLQSTLGKLAKEASDSSEPILWAPDPATVDLEEEMVTIQPILTLAQEKQRSGPKGTMPPMKLSLSPELLGTGIWKKLHKAYEEQIISSIHLDAKIRLDFYQQKAKGLRGDKDQWDKADEQQRLERWGTTVTLNQRFDNEIGLTIWLHPPEEISTKQYYEESVPGLIISYENWAAKMRGILKSMETAAKRPDDPFFRLITTRLFDAALRGGELEQMPRIQKLYREWAGPMADLLHFEWRKRLRSLRVNPEDLFTAHTTFNLRLMVQAVPQGKAITGLEMIPYTLLDKKRSVALFDRKRGFLIVNDPSDFPQLPDLQPAGDLRQELLQQSVGFSEDEIAEHLREIIIKTPQQACQQIIDLLKPQISDETLLEDSDQVRKAYQQGSRKIRFTRLVNVADNAMLVRALLTVRKNLEEARQSIPDLLKIWSEARASDSADHAMQPVPIPEIGELKCRLYLMESIAECLAIERPIKEELLAAYRSSRTGSKHEIRNALAAADNAHPVYTSKWIERLSNWDAAIAYGELIRGLPTEQELTSLEEYTAMRAFDIVELMHIAKALRVAITTLSHVQERRDAALVKLGPALEMALLSQAATVVNSDLTSLLQILTGRQVSFDS